MRIPIRLIATVALTLLTIGFLVLVWKACHRPPTKSPLETAAENVVQARIEVQVAHDTFLVRDAYYQHTQQQFDSLATRVYRGDPRLDARRDSLGAVIESAVRDSLRARAARQHPDFTGAAPRTQQPKKSP